MMIEYTCTLLVDGFEFLEAPRWREGSLWVSDIYGHKVYRIFPEGDVEHVCDIPGRPSGLAFLPDGACIVVSMTDRKLLRIDAHGVSEYADLSDLAPADLNDMVADDLGRLYVGNFGYDHFGGASKRPADLILVEPDRSARVVASDLDFPNGAVVTKEGRKLVVAESWANRLTRYERDAQGNLYNREVFADLVTRQPDGLCLDVEGGVWVACFNTGEVLRVLEGGEVTHRVSLGSKRAVACQLGGVDGRTLFCCSYDGTAEELAAGKPGAAIEVAYVDIPGERG